MCVLVWTWKSTSEPLVLSNPSPSLLEGLAGRKDYRNVTIRDQEQNHFNRVHLYYNLYIEGRQFSYNEHFHRSK
jgi:hypothetical protein